MAHRLFQLAASVFELASSYSEGHHLSFRQLSSGTWVPIMSAAKHADVTAEADVACGHPEKATIRITWLSESGDWTAYDVYSLGEGPFFTREVRYAQHLAQLKIVQNKPSARFVRRYVGPDAAFVKSIYAPPELKIFRKAGDVPFSLPSCARRMFTRKR